MDEQELERIQKEEAIKEQVLKELEEARKGHSMVSYLNNLQFNLDRALRSESRDDFIITYQKEAGCWDRPKKDFDLETDIIDQILEIFKREIKENNVRIDNRLGGIPVGEFIFNVYFLIT